MPGRRVCDKIYAMEEMTGRLISAIRTVRAPAAPAEYDIHAMLAAAFDAAGLEYVHEYRLAPRCRLDFMCSGVAVEVKKGRPQIARLMRQLSRYMRSADVRAMVVVVQRRIALPETICGKPVRVVALNMLWGVALP